MTILWLITKLGKSVHRVIQDGSLALSGTLYKGLSWHGIHPSSGAHHLFLKEDKFHSDYSVEHLFLTSQVASRKMLLQHIGNSF